MAVKARRDRALPVDVNYALQVRQLRKTYRTRKGRQPALDGLDLNVPAGGVPGFVGPNGSGRTTTIRSAFGLIKA